MRSCAPRKIIEEEFVSGVIQFFNKERGFGFINRIGDCSKDYFFHFSEIEGGIEEILSAIKNSMLVIFDIGVTPCGRREAVHIKIFDSRLYINDLETCSKDCPCRMANTQMLMNPGKRLRNNQLKPITSSRGTKSSSETESSSSSWRTPDIQITRRSKILERKMYSVVGQVY